VPVVQVLTFALKINNRNMKKRGFTLIESLVVITMMMVVIAIASVSYSSASKKNRDNRRVADLERIRTALELFRQEDLGGSYPASDGALVTGGYIDAWPVGPKGVTDTYTYVRGGSNYTYLVTTTLETTGVGYSVANP